MTISAEQLFFHVDQLQHRLTVAEQIIEEQKQRLDVLEAKIKDQENLGSE